MAGSQQAGAAICLPTDQQGPPPTAGSMHWLPFSVAYDGPVAAVDQYFTPQRDEPAGEMSAWCAVTHPA